jgi:acyl-CoA synthetase (AMP-forming)/AMP-acid ligase II/thioesterase domain-containing protein/acyl carrier protein
MISLKDCGSIHDIERNLQWDSMALARQVNSRAAALAKMKVGRGSLVGILHNGSAHFFADLFATWMVGATAACLDSHLTDAELNVILEFAKPAVLLVKAATRTLNISTPVLELDGDTSAAADFTSRFHEDDPAIVLFTSGTTGNPKGVVLTFRALLARISANVAAIGKTNLARTLVALPTHFGHGLIGNSLTPLMNGGTIVLHPLGLSLASNLGRIIDEHRITFMSSVPAIWHTAKSQSRPPAGDSLLRVHVGSAPLSEQLWSEIAAWSRAEVVNCYGLTETANWIAGASSRSDGIAEGLVGRCWGSTIAVMGDDGDIRSSGRGEIVVQSPGLMSGYLDRPDLTAAVLRDGWFHTGDRGYVDDNGLVWLTGRIKDEINRGGSKVQPAEIDLLLERHPAIAEACTFAIADPISGQTVGVLVRPVKGVTPTPESLQTWCRERLRQIAVPERWIFVDEIPRNARGKVNRDAVSRMFAEGRFSARSPDKISPDKIEVIGAASAAARPSAESAQRSERASVGRNAGAARLAVEKAWTEILGKRTFTADLPWGAAGGDSLNAMRLWFLIEKVLGRHLSMEAMHEEATPSEIIGAIAKMLDESERSAPEATTDDGAPLVFYMPPADGDLPVPARFRAGLKDKIRFVIIEYPTWQEMMDAGSGFDAIVDAAEAQIHAHGERQSYYLAGFSFGGFVAWETACRLAQSGRQVDFVGLIDTRRAWDQRTIERSDSGARKGPLARIAGIMKALITQPRESLTIRWLLPRLVKNKLFWPLRLTGRLAGRLRSRAAFEFQFRLALELRQEALRNLEVSSFPMPITLFRSDEFDPDSADYGWATKSSHVTVVPLSASHLSLLETAELSQRFLEAIEAASEAAGSHRDRSAQPGSLRPASARRSQ